MTPTLDRLIASTTEIDPPLAALDLPTLRANAADLVRRAGGTPVRVASKSVRCRAVLQVALGENLTAAGGFRGIMAYSLHEAIWLARHGAQDILMGYPTADRGALAELAAEPELLHRIALMVDSDDHLDFVSAAAGTTSLRARLCIDVDASLRLGPVHIGVRRSPLREPSAVAAFAQRAAARGFAVVGVMFYEAQIAGLPDSSPPIGWMKRASARELATRRGAERPAVMPLAIRAAA